MVTFASITTYAALEVSNGLPQQSSIPWKTRSAG